MNTRRTVHQCKNPPDNFCNLCGNYMIKAQSHAISESLKIRYEKYFGVHFVQEGKWWIPSRFCSSCKTVLNLWSIGKKKNLPFSIPTSWAEPADETDCFFCQTNVLGFSRKNKSSIMYPDYTCVKKAVADKLDKPSPPGTDDPDVSWTDEDDEEEDILENDENQSNYGDSGRRGVLTQEHVKEVTQSLNLSQRSAERLCTLLKNFDVLSDDVRITEFRGRNKAFRHFFECKEDYCVCVDVDALLLELGLPINPNEWRLFLDGSRRSFKAVLLHNGNKFASVPIFYSKKIKEDYDGMAKVIDAIKWSDHQWEICSDYKVVSKLMGLKPGFPSFMCHLCLWNTRSRSEHYVRKEWPPREDFEVGKYSIIETIVVPPGKVLMAPLHVKLGLVKNFLKTLKTDSEAFTHYRRLFKELSDGKAHECNLTGPQIRKLFQDQEFAGKLNAEELRAWNALQNVCSKFLGNIRAPNYEEVIGGTFVARATEVNPTASFFNTDVINPLVNIDSASEWYLWYLSEWLVPFALFDDRISTDVKNKCVEHMKKRIENVSDPPLRLNRKLEDCLDLTQLFTTKSQDFFKILDLPMGFLSKSAEEWFDDAYFQRTKSIDTHCAASLRTMRRKEP
ncbi:hypothetical protein DMENIID0001_037820 [Sergentomyia squamirostris]